MSDDAVFRLLGFNGRLYWMPNGWCVRFRVRLVVASEARPHGIRYSLTLHDDKSRRLLGFDNAHKLPDVREYDHSHRFRRTRDVVPYAFSDPDTLMVDFFTAVQRACAIEQVLFTFVAEGWETVEEDDDEVGPPTA